MKLQIPIIHLPHPPARWERRNTLIAITIYTASGLISFAVIAILYNILR